jgi:CIC family chloride channel protein
MTRKPSPRAAVSGARTGTARPHSGAGDVVHPAPRSDRVRVPPPLIRRRLGSGRGATEQPNATGDGEGALTPVFWGMVVLTGIAAGLLGDELMLLLHGVQHLAFGYHSGSFVAGVARASGLRRVVSLAVAGLIGGVAWTLLRRYTRGEKSEVDDVLWNGDGVLSPRRSLGTSVISEIVIGMGASLGKEAAPKLMGGVAGSVLGRRIRVPRAPCGRAVSATPGWSVGAGQPRSSRA